MQPLHWGSFCAQDGEKSDGTLIQSTMSVPTAIRRETRRDPWNFSPYLRLVYHKALSGTYQKIHLSAQKVLTSTYRRIFG